MKKIVIIVTSILLLFAIDFLCIFMLNRPLFAIKGDLPHQYVGLLYDTYNCPEYSTAFITKKGSKFTCAEIKYENNNVVHIVDTTKNIKDFVCAEALEEFYEDTNYRYYYNCIKSKYIIVRYENGNEETVEEALKNKNIKIEDLDRYNIDYIKYNKETIEKTFTRTYIALNIAESNDYDYLYLTVRYFQGEEIETVKVERDLAKNVVEDKYYEFTFKTNNSSVEDNIESIFQNATLISIQETNKTGLDQIQDDI